MGWPEFDEDALAQIVEDACQGKTSLDEIERLDLVPFLEARLDRQQARELNASAPKP